MNINNLIIKINAFLNNTTLTAKDTIILSVVSSLITVFIAFALKTFFINCFKKIYSLLINVYNYIRLKLSNLLYLCKMRSKGILTHEKYLELKQKKYDGIKLSKKESYFFVESKKYYNDNLDISPKELKEKFKKYTAKYKIDNQ